MEEIIKIGIDRILTSGQKPTAIMGAVLLAQLVKRAANRIIIMPGSGINEENILDLAKKTQAKEFHGSFRKKIQSKMKFRNKQAFMGSSDLSEYEFDVSDETKIKKAIQKNKISVSFRGDAVRVSPHLYNSETDLMKLVRVLVSGKE